MAEPHRAGRRLDVPILLIALVVATTAVVWIGNRMTAARCRDAGGQMRMSGLDQVCERADGSRLVTEPLLTGTGWGLGGGLWLVAIAGAYGGMRWYLRARQA